MGPINYSRDPLNSAMHVKTDFSKKKKKSQKCKHNHLHQYPDATLGYLLTFFFFPFEKCIKMTLLFNEALNTL